MGKEEKLLLSLGRESLVYRQGEYVIKCYAPEKDPDFGERYRKLFREGDTFHLREYDYDLRKNFFHKEAALLKALSRMTPRMVPVVGEKGIDYKQFSLKMEFIPYPDFQQAITTQNLDPVASTERMVRILVGLHDLCKSQTKYLQKKRHSRTRLRTRSIDEEVTRWMNYLQTIIFYESDDFEKCLKQKEIDPQDHTTQEIRGYIGEFLRERGIELKERVTNFIKTDRNLTYNEASFVWAEAKPQNIFYIPPEEKRDVIIDLPRARRGAGSDIDLFTIINNHHRGPFTPEREEASIYLANEYFKLVGTPAEDIPARHARLLATGIKEAVRLHANYCQKNPYEIYTILGRQDEYPGENGEKVTEGFLEEKIDSLRKFFDYYRYRSGEGWELVVEGPLADKPEYRALVRQQIETIEEILKDSGVLRGVIRSQRRAKKFRTILAPRY